MNRPEAYTCPLPPPSSLLPLPSRFSQSTGFGEREVFDTRPPVQILCPQNSAQGYTWTQGHAGMVVMWGTASEWGPRQRVLEK